MICRRTLGIFLAGLACLTSAQTALSATSLTPQEARVIAKEAYIYGFPMEDSYRTMYAFSIAKGNPEYKGPFNSVLNIARVFTPDDKGFVTPNSDTPYTFLGLDLRAEPIVLTIPAIEKNRYYVFQMMDFTPSTSTTWAPGPREIPAATSSSPAPAGRVKPLKVLPR